MVGRARRRAVALSLAATLAACAAGPRIDTRYSAVSQDSRVRFIIVHFTQMDEAGSLHRLTREEVSSHYLVGREPPTIWRLVPEERRAWHAGPSYWRGATALNASSVGIEIVNLGNGDVAGAPYQAFPEAQIEAVVALVRAVAKRHGVAPDRILGHAEVQPQTRNDPGPRFPWRRLAEAGLIPWPDAAQVAAAAGHWRAALPSAAWWQERLAAHGYQVPRSGELDGETRRVLAVFQMRYRPERYDGEPDAETAALLEVVTTPGGLQLRRPDGHWAAFTAE
ncbi:MAG: N-acetylmuramoyl-L-alanine amidase [Proteobacteria bacterium]|nr:N-acetylmuramoyl-L-alanine amidase [Pseudomonadota bacterium]